MKLWISTEPAPAYDRPEDPIYVHCTTPDEATRLLLAGAVEEVVLGGPLGRAVAEWLEMAAFCGKVKNPVRWSVLPDGHFLDRVNADSAMKNAEVYWGVRRVELNLAPR